MIRFPCVNARQIYCPLGELNGKTLSDELRFSRVFR